ncbi:hypothetical protein VNO78_32589 [Psophocarpus tetragonolobus]|uniref:Miraculin n=1 Tax=Psophocarpus tetragonolobus TaxID=3891 RepID=A0AAN9NVX7_PSOTE
MKSTMLLALALVLALCSQPLLGGADASPEQVVDTLGKKVRVSENYYIIPSVPHPKFRAARGLDLASVDKACPLDVVVVNGYHGLPLTFAPVNPKKGVIRVSIDLNIKFSTLTSCPRQSTVWKLDRFDFSNRQWFVTTGGVVGNPSLETINNWFKIEKYDGAYKLVYCPSVVKSQKHLCKNVGLFVDEKGNRRLALTDVPLKVQFQHA